MNKTCFLLISVLGDELLTEQFSTLRSANAAMKEEMVRMSDPEIRCFVEEAVSDTDNWEKEYDDGDFGFGVYEGYLNDMIGRENCSWRIVQVTLE